MILCRTDMFWGAFAPHGGTNAPQIVDGAPRKGAR